MELLMYFSLLGDKFSTLKYYWGLIKTIRYETKEYNKGCVTANNKNDFWS